MTALLGNNAQLTFVSFAGASAQIRSKKVRALACFGERRNPHFPDVPTLRELGYELEFYLWVGLFGPRGMPDAITAKLRSAAKEAVAADAFAKSMRNLEQDVGFQDSADFKRFLEADRDRVEEAVRLIGRS